MRRLLDAIVWIVIVGAISMTFYASRPRRCDLADQEIDHPVDCVFCRQVNQGGYSPFGGVLRR